MTDLSNDVHIERTRSYFLYLLDESVRQIFFFLTKENNYEIYFFNL